MMQMLIKSLIAIILIEYSSSSYVFDATIGETSVECNYWRYKYGCEDSIGSECVSGLCVCKHDYTVRLRYGYCLKPLAIGESCITSSQCSVSHNNSECISSNSEFTEWWCQCKANYFYDSNNTLSCVKKLNYGEECWASEQCLDDNSVCDRISAKCACDAMFYYNFTLNRCTHVNNTGCDDGFEWNKHTNRCDHKVYYSNKGGGGRGGGRGGSRSSSRSWGKSSGSGSSWFYKRRPIYVGGTGGSGRYSSGGEEEVVDVFKVILVVIAVITIIMAFCYCSFKMKQQDEEDKQYYENRASIKRPSSFEAKTSTDSNKPFIKEEHFNIDMPIQQTSTDYDRVDINLSSSFEASFPSRSPPPPYSEDGKLLPFASSHSPSHSKTEQLNSINNNLSAVPSAPPLSVYHQQNSDQILPFASNTEWLSSSGGRVPENAIEGGRDINGEILYVGRAHRNGDLVPGKIVPSHGVCYIAYNGKEKAHRSYECFVRPNYGSVKWVRAECGDIPAGAVHGGHNSRGETLYIGRALHGGSLVIGKVHSSHKVLYLPFDCREVAISHYEVLCIAY